MIEENQGFPEATATPTSPASPSNDATQEAINPDRPSQQQFFDNFTQLGLSDKEKLNLLNAQGFDPESNYGLIMDDYNRRQEEMLANQERLEALNRATSASMEDLKKKDSSSGSSGEGFESGGTEFEDQAFGQPVATADFRNVLTMRSDEHEANYMVLADQAGQLKLEAEYIEDLEERNKKLAEAREIAAQANLEHGKAIKAQNGIYEMVGSDFRVNQESDVDEGFMQRNMFQRMKEDDARIKRDFGFVGVENRADLEEYKQLRQEGAFVDQTLEELRAEEYDPIDGVLESLYDNAFNTFGNLAFDRGIMVADLIGGEDSRMSKYWRGRKKQMNGKYQRARAAGMAELEIPENYQGLGVMDTLGKALTGDMTALNKFVTYDLPETLGMTAVYAADFFAMGALGRTVGATGKMSDSLAKAGQLSTRANMLSAMSQSVPATLFSYIPQGYESYRESHPEVPISKALFFGSLSGMAEGMMNAVTLGLGRGAEAAFARSVSGGMKQTIQKQVQEALKKKLSTGFLKDLGAEGLEEGMVAFAEQLISNASDVVDGKDPKTINFHSIADAFVVGALGASGPGALSVASSRLSHSSNLKDSRAQAKIVGELRKKYEAEKDPQKKQVLRDTYMRSLQKFDIIKKKDAQMYDTFNQEEVDEVMGIHQEIASISSTLRKGEFIEGGRVTKEEKAELKERLTDLFTRKAQIEKIAEDRAFKASVPSEVIVPDSGNKSRPAKERNVEQTEIDSHKRVPEATQPAPAELVQEEGQLLMFDENTMDDMVQRPGEEVKPPVEAEQQAEAPEAQQAEAAQQAEEDAVTVDLAAGETLDLRDTKKVGEGAGQVSISNARTINNLTKAFGSALKTAGAKLKAHRTMESFINSNEEVKNQNKYLEVIGVQGQTVAYLNPLTNEIHLSPEADIMDVMEEFGHLVLAPIIGKDAASRQALFAEMQKIAKGKSKGAKLVAKILAQSNEDYGNQSEAVQEEEAIISVLVNYAANPAAFASVADKIVKAINKVLKAAGLKKNIITGKEGLFALAEKFRQSSEGRATEVSTDAPVAEEAASEEAVAEEAPVAEEVAPEAEKKSAEDIAADKTLSEDQKRQALKDQADALLEGAEGISAPDEDVLADAASLDLFQGRMSVRRKQEFNYLKDTEIFYTARPYLQAGDAVVTSSRYTTYSSPRSIRVNDYFHFRNWYNKTTGNQTADRIGEMYFIKDGKKYAIKPPRPRVDKDGKKVPMALPPSPKDIYNQRKIQDIESQKEVTRKLAKLRDSNRALFATIPWKQFVNAGQFAPASKPIQEMTINDQYISAVIEQKNMQEALEMGLTKNEVRERIKQPGRAGVEGLNRIMDGDIVNATGLAPFDEAETGDVVANMRFSTRRRDQLGDPDHILSDKELSDFLEGKYEDLTGVFMPISGYDQSMPDQEKGITSGIRAVQELDAADVAVKEGFRPLEDDEVIISTHVSFEYARQRMGRYTKEAEAIYRRAEREGSPKAARKLNMSGKFGAGFSILKPEATRGNPDVAKSYLNGLLARSRDKTNNISGPSLYAMFTTNGKKAIRSMVRMAQAEGFGGLSQDTAFLFEGEKDLPVTTQKQFEEIIDVAINYNDRLADQFEKRKELFSKKLLAEFFSHEKFELGRTIPDESLSMDEQIAEYFNDPVLSQQKPATLIGYKTFNYEIDPDILDQNGQVRLANMRVVELEGYGFGGAVVVKRPGPDAKLKVFREQFTLDKIDPELFQTSEASTSKKAAEVAKAETPYEKAEMLNRYSRAEFNAEAQDVNIKASVRRRQGFVKGETTNGSWQMRDMNGFQRWRNTWLKRLQDKYVDIFQLQSDVEAARGKRAADQDFQMAEELMYGKAAEDLRKLDVKVDAITDLIKDRGLSVQDVSDYLYALHAKERNELIKERTNGQNKEGSGMSDARADLILKSLEGRSDSLKEIVDLVREIQQDTRDTMVKFGLETQEAIDAFEAQFENYVPLSGIAIDEETSFTSSYPTGGAGMSVFGPTTKRAEGRQSEATNILAQVIAQNSSIHIKARTNEALQSLYNLVESNPNEDVWRILDAKNVNSKDPHIVSVRVNGEQKFIRFKDASYAETLRNMNLPQTSVFVRMMRAPANWLRRSFTTLNPEFMISNFSRDIQAAMFNAAAEADIPGGVIEGQGIVTEMIKNVPKTLKVLLRSESPEALKKFFAENPEVERYYNEFRDDGGKTGWSYAKPLDRIAADLQSKSSEKSKMQNLFGKAEEFAQVVEGYNDAFENSIRLSSYIAARERGVTREKAAQMAKNITVNFNKSGEYGQLLNSVYLFFNASVQGTARLGKSLLTMKSPTYPDGTKRAFKDRFNNAQKMAAALTVFSGLSAMIAMAMSDEDEDGELYYNKIPDYIKERNLIFMRPNGKDYFKIPLPYGFSMFANLGTTAVEVGAGHKEIDTAMMQLSSAFINSFSPISFGQSKDLFTKAGKSVVPTVFKPLVDVMTNETYFGGPVYTENLPYGLQRPESSLSFRSPEGVQQFFRWMNEATGGSVDVKGDLDFNPDKMWYMFEYFIGGAGKFVERTGSTAMKLKAKAEDNDIRIEANDIPFMRILYGEPSKYMDMEDYSRRRQEIMQLTKELKNNPRRDKGERYIGVLGLNNSLKSFDKQLKAIRAAKRQALKIKDYTERMKRIQELRDKERRIVMRFNKQYETIRGKED